MVVIKRCPICGHKLNEFGKCTNTNCPYKETE